MGRTLKKPEDSTSSLHGSGKTIPRPPGKGKSFQPNMRTSAGKTLYVPPQHGAALSSSAHTSAMSEDDSSSSELSEVLPRTPVKKKKKATKAKRMSRKSATLAIKRTRSLVEKQASLPVSGTAASKRREMVSATTTTSRLDEHLQSPLVQAYTTLEVNNMRKIERQRYGRVDPYAFVKTNFSSLITRVVKDALLENGEIEDEDTEVVVTVPSSTMTFLKCINTRRLGNLIMGVNTICESANRKRITAQHLMAYNRIARPIDDAVRDLPMSTGGAPIDLTVVNDAANEAEKTLHTAGATSARGAATKKPRAPRKKLTPEQKETAAKLTAERKRRREETVAKKKEEAQAKKQKKAEEVAERKRKKEEEVAEKKKRREEAAAEKKLRREEAAAKKKRKQEEVMVEDMAGKEEAATTAVAEKKQKRKEDAVEKQRKGDELVVEDTVRTDKNATVIPTVVAPKTVFDFLKTSPKKRERAEDGGDVDDDSPSPVKKSKKTEEVRNEDVHGILASLLNGSEEKNEDGEGDFDYDF